MNLILWFLVWLAFWTAYNAFFKWRIENSHRKKYFWFSIFFLICAFVAYFLLGLQNKISLIPSLTAWVIALLIGFFFSAYFPFYKHIRNGKYFLVAMASDVLFQQVMILIALNILGSLIKSNYFDLYFGLFFMLLHFPILFFKWARLRYLLFFLPFIGGAIFSFLIRNFGELGIILAFLIHFCTYIPIFYKLKDERFV